MILNTNKFRSQLVGYLVFLVRMGLWFQKLQWMQPPRYFKSVEQPFQLPKTSRNEGIKHSLLFFNGVRFVLEQHAAVDFAEKREVTNSFFLNKNLFFWAALWSLCHSASRTIVVPHPPRLLWQSGRTWALGRVWGALAGSQLAFGRRGAVWLLQRGTCDSDSCCSNPAI